MLRDKIADVCYTARTRYYYKDGQKIWLDTLVCERAIFNPAKAELSSSAWVDSVDKSQKSDSDIVESQKSDSDNAERAARRARKKLYELALCNEDLTCFCTLTVSPDVGMRYDYNKLVKLLKDWLGNRVQRQGLKYILVPELHKDGAVHFHGLFNEALRLVDSGTVLVPCRSKPVRISTADKLHVSTDDRQPVYNVADWDIGYSTAMLTSERSGGSREAAAAYVSKYISKDTYGGKVGGRYYLSGGKLARPECVYYNAAIDHDLGDCDDYTVKEFGICGTSWQLLRPTAQQKGG